MADKDMEIASMRNAWSIGLTLAASYIIYKLLTRKRNLPPGPVGIPLLGAVHEMKHQGASHFDFDRLSKKYGDIFSIYLGAQLTIVLNSYEVIKEAFLKRGDDFSDRALPGFEEFLDYKSALFTANFSNEWKDHKRFAVQALKNTGFGTAKGEEKIVNEVAVLLKYIENQNGSAFDPKIPLQNTAANVITSILLNSSQTWGNEEQRRFINVATDSLESISDAFDLHFINMFIPKFLMKIMWSSKMNNCSSGFQKLWDFAWKHIEEHRMTYDPDYTRDFLDVYQKEERDKTMDEKTFVSTIVDFLPDGPGTATEAMTWAILLLGHHPDVQIAAQKQLDEVCGERPPNLADRKALPFVEAIITETLRIRGPAPFSAPHVAMKNTTLKGYNIPRDNTVIMANLYSCHMNPRDFPEPEKFNPSRFINKDGKLFNTERVIPFGMGSRMCIASQFAKAVLFLVLSNVLQRFHIRFPADQPNPTLEPDNYFFTRPQKYKVCAIPR